MTVTIRPYLGQYILCCWTHTGMFGWSCTPLNICKILISSDRILLIDCPLLKQLLPVYHYRRPFYFQSSRMLCHPLVFSGINPVPIMTDALSGRGRAVHNYT